MVLVDFSINYVLLRIRIVMRQTILQRILDIGCISMTCCRGEPSNLLDLVLSHVDDGKNRLACLWFLRKEVFRSNHQYFQAWASCRLAMTAHGVLAPNPSVEFEIVQAKACVPFRRRYTTESTLFQSRDNHFYCTVQYIELHILTTYSSVYFSLSVNPPYV